ncbi:MAG: 2-polyprenyl-3-methyl-6-methoxy-1,4-benzoquinone monooxygenase [Gammaproteobacteria bacterium]|nr:MAG: 2-polyprenyl-3-methyl-6-methoxy-1,4-benzoquinone monooxygenase [Gammaproteobacteria bacterium]
MRSYTPVDRALLQLDLGLRTLFGRPRSTGRPHPGEEFPDRGLEEPQRRHVEGLMRVDHTGEVCAQALYQGQALTARDRQVAERLMQAAEEENDHLIWCERRLQEIGGRKSLLNPFWYLASLGIGAAAGLAGDRLSLGFLAETERQVVRHLEEHLASLPARDRRSRAILEQMKVDEACHAATAERMGAQEVPPPLKLLMKLQSKVMTTTAYRI